MSIEAEIIAFVFFVMMISLVVIIWILTEIYDALKRLYEYLKTMLARHLEQYEKMKNQVKTTLKDAKDKSVSWLLRKKKEIPEALRRTKNWNIAKNFVNIFGWSKIRKENDLNSEIVLEIADDIMKYFEEMRAANIWTIKKEELVKSTIESQDIEAWNEALLHIENNFDFFDWETIDGEEYLYLLKTENESEAEDFHSETDGSDDDLE